MEFDFIKNDKNINITDIFKIIEHLYKDYLLSKRLIYKLSSQFRSHKQFKYLIEFRKKMENLLTLKNLENNGECEFKANHILRIFSEKQIENLNELTIKIGCILKEMMLLKLHIPYCVIVLGIISRVNFLLSFLCLNSEKIVILFSNIDVPNSKIEKTNQKETNTEKNYNQIKCEVLLDNMINNNSNNRYFNKNFKDDLTPIISDIKSLSNCQTFQNKRKSIAEEMIKDKFLEKKRKTFYNT